MTTKTWPVKKNAAGRKPTASAEKVGPQFVGKTPEADARKEIALRQRMEQIINHYGDGLPYVREHCMAEIRRGMARTIESVISVGRCLIVMKAHEPHGEWLGCLRASGLGEDNAHRMMAAARRIDSLPNSAPARNLLTSVNTPSKLFDLLSLPDDQLTEIAEGGEGGGLTRDDIEQMTRTELRDALREARKDKAALDERNAKLQKTAEKSELDAAKARRAWKAAEPDERTQLLRQELDAEVLQLSIRLVSQDDALTSLRHRVQAFVEHAEQHGQDHQVYLAGVFAQLERYLHQVRDEFYIPRLAIGDPAIEAQEMLGLNKKK